MRWSGQFPSSPPFLPRRFVEIFIFFFALICQTKACEAPERGWNLKLYREAVRCQYITETYPHYIRDTNFTNKTITVAFLPLLMSAKLVQGLGNKSHFCCLPTSSTIHIKALICCYLCPPTPSIFLMSSLYYLSCLSISVCFRSQSISFPWGFKMKDVFAMQ